MNTIKIKLKEFKLSGIYNCLEERLCYAKEKSLSHAEFLELLMKGFRVLFTSVSEMLQALNASRADNSYYQKVNYYLNPDLLILDELGFKKLPSYSADDFFEIISKRYERGSIIITTNKSFEQWADIFSDAILASAILDRIVHYSTVIKITGHSYRSKSLKKEGGEKKAIVN